MIWSRRRPHSAAPGCSSQRCLALFTGFGWAASAYVSVAAGMLVWAAGKYAVGLPAPYLMGVLAASIAYVCVALLEPAANEQLFRKSRRDI